LVPEETIAGTTQTNAGDQHHHSRCHLGCRRHVALPLQPLSDRHRRRLTTAKEADLVLAPGAKKTRTWMEFTYDGGGIGKGAGVTLYVDGQPVGEGRLERTTALFFSMDETTEIGRDMGEPVSHDYGPRGNAFNGKVKWVQIDIDAAAKDVDHLIGAEERFQLAVTRQ
jgi:hypothetical protein